MSTPHRVRVVGGVVRTLTYAFLSVCAAAHKTWPILYAHSPNKSHIHSICCRQRMYTTVWYKKTLKNRLALKNRLFFSRTRLSFFIGGTSNSITAHTMITFGYFPSDLRTIRSAVSFSFDQYRSTFASFMKSLERISSNINKIDQKLDMFKSVHDKFLSSISLLPRAYEVNENCLRKMLEESELTLTYGISYTTLLANSDEAGGVPWVLNSHLYSYNDLSQVLVHLNRDWGEGGGGVRSMYKNSVVAKLIELDENFTNKSVLVPGAGLGRLAAELAAVGYRFFSRSSHLPF